MAATVIDLMERRGLARMTEAQWRDELKRSVKRAIGLERHSAIPNLTVIAQLDTVYEMAVIAEAEIRSLRDPDGAA